MSVSDTGSPNLEDLLRGMDIEVSVGIHEDKGAEAHGNLTNAEIGAVHEFGLGVPQRSFIRGYFDEKESELQESADAALARILDGADPLVEAGRMGLKLEGGMKERILARIPPPLAESTRARRGENAVPLVDTSQLIGSISSKVTVKK